MIGQFGETGDNIRTWGIGISQNQIAAAYYFTLFPWASTQASVKLFDWNILTKTKEIKKEKWKVYPNPTTNYLNLSFPKRHSGEVSINILIITGNSIFSTSTNVQDGLVSLPLNHLAGKGIYIIEALIGKEVLVEKVVVY